MFPFSHLLPSLLLPPRLLLLKLNHQRKFHSLSSRMTLPYHQQSITECAHEMNIPESRPDLTSIRSDASPPDEETRKRREKTRSYGRQEYNGTQSLDDGVTAREPHVLSWSECLPFKHQQRMTSSHRKWICRTWQIKGKTKESQAERKSANIQVSTTDSKLESVLCLSLGDHWVQRTLSSCPTLPLVILQVLTMIS